MKRLFANKSFVVLMTVIVIIAVIIIGLIPNSPVNKVMKPVGKVVAPIQRVVKDFGNIVSDFWAAITDGVAIRDENEQLKEEIALLQYQLTQNEEAAIRYEELREAFHIRDTFSNYDIFSAPILSREADEWFSMIRVGLGNRDGITMLEDSSYAVVDVRMNLIGRVVEIGDNETRILPILHEGFVVSGKVNTVNGITLTVMGDASLKREGLCLVTGIDEDTLLEEGMEIVTSGEGGLFPQGIPIGTIVSVDSSNPLNITATLRPYSNIGEINDVFVMVSNEVSEENSTSDEVTDETSAA